MPQFIEFFFLFAIILKTIKIEFSIVKILLLFLKVLIMIDVNFVLYYVSKAFNCLFAVWVFKS